jgi:hypothetical protein
MCVDAKDFEIASKSNINKKKELQDLMPQNYYIFGGCPVGAGAA